MEPPEIDSKLMETHAGDGTSSIAMSLSLSQIDDLTSFRLRMPRPLLYSHKHLG